MSRSGPHWPVDLRPARPHPARCAPVIILRTGFGGENRHGPQFFFCRRAKELRQSTQFLLRLFEHGGAAPSLTYRGTEWNIRRSTLRPERVIDMARRAMTRNVSFGGSLPCRLRP